MDRSIFNRIGATAILLALASTTWGECKVISNWEPWEPYQYMDDAGKVTGLDNDLLSAIAREAGCEVFFAKRPWKRSLQELKNGQADVAPGASITEERKAFANFSDIYRNETMAMMVLKENLSKFPFKRFDDFEKSGMRVGVVRGYYYGERFKKAMESKEFRARVQMVNGDDKNLKKLLKGRIDGALIDPFVGTFLLKQMDENSRVAIHPVTINSDGIYLMYSKKSVSKEVIEKLNNGLKAIRASGEYQKIVDGYLQ